MIINEIKDKKDLKISELEDVSGGWWESGQLTPEEYAELCRLQKEFWANAHSPSDPEWIAYREFCDQMDAKYGF